MSRAHAVVAIAGLLVLGMAGAVISLFGLLSRSYGSACSTDCSHPTSDLLATVGAGVVLLAALGVVGVIVAAKRRS